MKKYLLILFTFPLLISCDLFVTRDAELPDQGRSNFQIATEPEKVISNLKNSFADKNVQNYIACLIDSSFSSRKFSFQPTSEAVSQYQFLADNWDVSDEERYFSSIVASIQSDFPITLTLTDESFSRTGDTVIYAASYFINIPVNQPEVSNYEGRLQFNLVNDSRSVWVIYFWQDIKLPDIPSWSELKGRYY
jgi:hypothetical protein